MWYQMSPKSKLLPEAFFYSNETAQNVNIEAFQFDHIQLGQCNTRAFLKSQPVQNVDEAQETWNISY